MKYILIILFVGLFIIIFNGCSIKKVEKFRNIVFYEAIKNLKNNQLYLDNKKFEEYYTNDILFVPKVDIYSENKFRFFLNFYTNYYISDFVVTSVKFDNRLIEINENIDFIKNDISKQNIFTARLYPLELIGEKKLQDLSIVIFYKRGETLF